MSYQAPHQVTSRATLSPATVEELLADPSRTRGLVLESVPELLTQVASRVASLKTLEGALLALMLSQRVANRGARNAAVRFWVRRNSRSFSAFRNRGSENRLASATSHRSNSATTFASGSKKSSAFSPNAPAKPLDFRACCLYATYSMTGVEIRALREKLGWTQMALAEAVGVTSNTVARWERGEMAISEPAARLLQKIAAEQRSRTGKR